MTWAAVKCQPFTMGRVLWRHHVDSRRGHFSTNKSDKFAFLLAQRSSPAELTKNQETQPSMVQQFTPKLASNSHFLGLAMWIYSIDKKEWRIMKHNSGPIARRAHAVTNLSGTAQFVFYFVKLQVQLVLLFCSQAGSIISGRYRQIHWCSFLFVHPSDWGYPNY